MKQTNKTSATTCSLHFYNQEKFEKQYIEPDYEHLVDFSTFKDAPMHKCKDNLWGESIFIGFEIEQEEPK